jgi:hypothetical protein
LFGPAADIVMRKMDRDGDGKISYDDYFFTVQENHLLLEFLGQCLPNDKVYTSSL